MRICMFIVCWPVEIFLGKISRSMCNKPVPYYFSFRSHLGFLFIHSFIYLFDFPLSCTLWKKLMTCMFWMLLFTLDCHGHLKHMHTCKLIDLVYILWKSQVSLWEAISKIFCALQPVVVSHSWGVFCLRIVSVSCGNELVFIIFSYSVSY